MKGVISYFFVTVCVFMSFISCSQVTDGGRGSQSDKVVKYLDIVDATNLYVSTGSAANRSVVGSSNVKKLFKITEAGYVEEVKYLDENKNEISFSLQPDEILSVNDEFVFVGFRNQEYSTWITSSYLVRKSDGAVFDMEKTDHPQKNYSDYANAPMIKTDRNNNLYFLTFSGEIVQVNLSGADTLTATTVSRSTDKATLFDVDRNGNVIYSGSLESNPAIGFTRLVKKNGGFDNLVKDMYSYWIGYDGNIYYQAGMDDEYYWEGEYDAQTGIRPTSGYPIKKLEIDEAYKLNNTLYGYTNLFNYRDAEFYKIDVQNRSYIIYSKEAHIAEVYNDSAKPREVVLDSLDIKTITAISVTEKYYYIAGLDSKMDTFLVRIDPLDDTCKFLLPRNEYDVFSFTVSETDGVVFNALRMNDGKTVIGQIGIDGGDVTMIDEEGDVMVTCLERIK